MVKRFYHVENKVLRDAQGGIRGGEILVDYLETPLIVPGEGYVLESEFVYDAENKTVTHTYTTRLKTQHELNLEDWKYPAYPIKFEIDGSVLFTQLGTAYRNYLGDKGYPVEIQDDDSYHVWVELINPAHQGFLDQLKQANLLTELSIPTE